MPRCTISTILPAVAVGFVARACVSVVLADSAAEGVDFFEKRIRPLLAEQCFECHSAQSKKVKGGLLLDSREAILQGGDSGPALVAGDPDKSRLVVAARHTDKELRMPPKRKLSDAQIADLEAWVKMEIGRAHV